MSSSLSIGPRTTARHAGPLSALDHLPLWPLGLIAALLFMRTALFLLLDVGLFAALPQAWPGSQIYLNALLIIPDLLTIGAVAYLLHRRGGSIREVLGRFRPADLGWGLLLGLIMLAGFLAATFAGNLIVYGGAPPAPTGGLPQVPLWVGIGAMIAPLTIATAERLTYGIGQDQLTRRFGTPAALIVVAAFFALQHAPLVLGGGADAVASKLIATFGAGLLFGGLLLWRRRVWPLIIAHWLLDILGLGLPTLALALS